MAGPEFPQRFANGGLENTVVGPVLASAATIAPTYGIHHVSGTATISSITAPWTGFTGCITLIPDGAWSLTTGGNIAVALTAVANSPVMLEFDGTSWFNVTGLYGGAGGAYSIFDPTLFASQFTDSKAQSSLFIAPLQLPVALQAASFAVNFSHTVAADSNCLAGYTNSVQIGIYTRSGNTLSSFKSTLATFTATVSSNSGSASVNGLREVNLPFACNLNPGNYWYGLLYSSTSSGASAVFGAGSASIAMVSVPGTQSVLSGLFESAANTAYKPYHGAGMLSVSTAAIPASIAFSDLAQASGTQVPHIIFKNFSAAS